jgi:hypothetical protein
VPGQQEFVEKMLTGSQRKTAFALRRNCETMIAGHDRRKLVEIELSDGKMQSVWQSIEPENLNCTGFLTLTVGNQGPEGFAQVWDAVEASRRINNLNRRVLPLIFAKAIVVTERHKNGAVHFHVLGILRSKADIRTGFDFKAFRAAREARAKGRVNHAAEVRYKLAASDELRALWQMLRDTLPGYGFGRAELTPIEKTSEAVACYISKYIEKNVCNRIAADKRKKLVRYIGWEKGQTKPNEFSWGTERAIAWRQKARALARVAGVTEKEQVSKKFGPRWAFLFTGTWKEIFGDDKLPWLDFTPNNFLRSLTALDKFEKKFKQTLAAGLSRWRAWDELETHLDYERTPEHRRAEWRASQSAARDFELEQHWRERNHDYRSGANQAGLRN